MRAGKAEGEKTIRRVEEKKRGRAEEKGTRRAEAEEKKTSKERQHKVLVASLVFCPGAELVLLFCHTFSLALVFLSSQD